MVLTPSGSVLGAVGAVGKVVVHEVLAAKAAGRGGRHGSERYLYQMLDTFETISHGDPPLKNNHFV
jgi:hypothetical protein